ncbi:MAG TPA: hypothetical protein DCE42_08735 [Myxococcales bacterium]|nr:hypothetical protein [Deltaproteobacteria bacterium]HAA54832.1 hypothetical protein [Myxococcales bacterium]|tara:strand:+ start:24926 stop:26350 length:1425 start_codon:yes stop_codon:yes gene_type:complete
MEEQKHDPQLSASWVDWFVSETLKQQGHETYRRARLLAGSCFIFFFSALAGIVLALTNRPFTSPVVQVSLLTMSGLLGCLLLLRKTGKLDYAGVLFTFSLALGIIVVSIFTGGIRSNIVPWGGLIILLTFFFSRMRWGLMMTVSLGLFVLTLYTYQELGYPLPATPPMDFKRRATGLVILIAFFISNCALSWLYESSRRKAIRLMEKTFTQNKQLAKDRDLARAMDQAKSQFLTNISHELRTPLNAIIGYTELLQETLEDDGQQEYNDDLQKIHRSGKHLLSLINDLLDLAKIESGKMFVQKEIFSTAVLCNDLHHSIEWMLKANNNTFALENHLEDVECCSDEKKLRQILLNLLSNACKFTENGHISLTCTESNVDKQRWLSFAIKDTGTGIPEDKQSKLFQSFSQLGELDNPIQKGTGLGLMLTKDFCELMGGSIEVISAEGQGSTFTVHLPDMIECDPPSTAPTPSPSETT